MTGTADKWIFFFWDVINLTGNTGSCLRPAVILRDAYSLLSKLLVCLKLYPSIHPSTLVWFSYSSSLSSVLAVYPCTFMQLHESWGLSDLRTVKPFNGCPVVFLSICVLSGVWDLPLTSAASLERWQSSQRETILLSAAWALHSSCWFCFCLWWPLWRSLVGGASFGTDCLKYPLARRLLLPTLYLCDGVYHGLVLTVSLTITLTLFFHCGAAGNERGVVVSEVSGFFVSSF